MEAFATPHFPFPSGVTTVVAGSQSQFSFHSQPLCIYPSLSQSKLPGQTYAYNSNRETRRYRLYKDKIRGSRSYHGSVLISGLASSTTDSVQGQNQVTDRCGADSMLNGQRVFLFGWGYVNSFMASRLVALGAKVTVAARTLPSESEIHQIASRSGSVSNWPIQVYPFNPQEHTYLPSQALHELQASIAIICSIPPHHHPGQGNKLDVVLEHYEDEVFRLLQKVKMNRAIVYFSSTSVYGKRSGEWVKETDPAAPHTAKAKLRLEAEMEWVQAFRNNALSRDGKVQLGIFRLSGIYGPGRNAFLTLLKGRSALAEFSELPISRVHVHDICTAAISYLKDAQNLENPFWLNVADDMPASRKQVDEYIFHVVEEIGLKLPDAALEMNATVGFSVRDASRANKLVDNTRMKQLLVPTLKYPTYKTGLAEICKEYQKDTEDIQ